MPYYTDDWGPSELYFERGSGEIAIAGPPASLPGSAQSIVDGNIRLLEAFKGFMDKVDRDAKEAARREGQPPPPVVPVKPVTTVTDPAPQQITPETGDSPARQGAPDLDLPPEAVVMLKSYGQPFDPPVSAEAPSHPAYDPLNPLDPEQVASLLSPPPGAPADFQALVDRIRKNIPESGEIHPTLSFPKSTLPAEVADPVDLFGGAFTLRVVDMVVPTPFIPIAMSRSYRSGRTYYGPFGHGWDHDYNVYLRPLKSGAFALWTGQLHEQIFVADGAGFKAPPGHPSRLERGAGPGEIFILHLPGGTRWLFELPAGWSDTQRIPLTTIADRHDNRVMLSYGANDMLVSVLDDSGRGLRFTYGSCNLLERVTDHSHARAIRYDHDAEIEHLVRVSMPPTAHYPGGPSCTYEYDKYAAHPAMRHNILRVFDTAGRLTVENDYAGPDAGWEFNSVVSQRLGGFEYQFGYEQIQYVAPDPAHIDVLATRTLVRTPDGALHTYTFNYRGDLLDHRFRLGLDGSFRVAASQQSYDAEGNMTRFIGPDGLVTAYTFDASNADPCARRNLLRAELISPFPDIVPSRIIMRGIYDPNFQLPVRRIDEAGAETRYLYDFDISPVGASGRLERIDLPDATDADGAVQTASLRFESNARGQITATVTAENNRTTMRYFTGGLLDGFLEVNSRDPGVNGLETRFSYDAAGFPEQVEFPGGRVCGFVHNALGQIEVATQPEIDGLKGTHRTRYDDSGGVVRVERPAGDCASDLLSGDAIIDEYVRDEVGNLRSGTLAANTGYSRSWKQVVDHEGRVISVFNGHGVRTDRSFDERGVLLHETVGAGDPLARTAGYVYDLAGRLVRATGPAQEVKKFKYDVWGRVQQVLLQGGALRSFSWGAGDRLLEERVDEADASGNPTRPLKRLSHDYDERGRLRATTTAAFIDDLATAIPLTTRIFYNRDDRPQRCKLPRGSETSFLYDGLGRLVETTDLHGNSHLTIYDAVGDAANSVSTMIEGGVARVLATKHDFDGRGRLRKSECLTQWTLYEYDDRNLLKELGPSQGAATSLRIDALGQAIERITDPAGFALVNQCNFDAVGNLIRQIDPTGATTSWEYDIFGTACARIMPDGARMEAVTDVATRTISWQLPSGARQTTEYSVDSTQPIALTCIAGAGQEAVAPHHFEYDSLGRLVRAEFEGEVITRRYDSLDRLIEEAARGKSVTTAYDDVAGTADLTYPDGRRETAEFNPDGQLKKLTLAAPGTLGGTSGDLLIAPRYSAAGRLSGMTYGNGVEGQLAYDDLGRVIRMQYESGGALIDSCRTLFDASGHRAVTQYIGAPARDLLHAFDLCGRLTQWQSDLGLTPLSDHLSPFAQVADVQAIRTSASGAPGAAFTLDGTDVRTAQTGLFGGAADQVYSSGADHRTTAIGAALLDYSEDGCRVSDPDFHYELDALQRVRRVVERGTGTIATELKYDALSRPASGSNAGQPFERWFAGSTRIHELSGPGPGILRQYSLHPLWPAPLCVTDAGGPSFIHQDQGWSTMCVTGTAGSVLERHRYDVFGASATFAADGVTPLAATRIEPVWRGMPTLGKTPLYFTPHRLYDPQLGVFTSRDPLLYADSPSPYAFAAHNPVDFADPTGLAKSPLGDLSAPNEGGTRTSEVIVTGQTAYDRVMSDPIIRGRGRIEWGDLENFAKGGYNGLVNILPLLVGPIAGPLVERCEIPRATIDPRYGGGGIVGEQLLENVALEAAVGLPAIGRMLKSVVTGKSVAAAVKAPVFWMMGVGGPGGGSLNAARTAGKVAPTSVEIIDRFTELVAVQNGALSADLVAHGKFLTGPEAEAALHAPARAYGQVLERMVEQAVRGDPLLAPYFEYWSGPGRSDWGGRGPLEGLMFDLTTKRGAAAHYLRRYGENMVVITYGRPLHLGF